MLESYFKGLLSWFLAPWFWLLAMIDGNRQRKEAHWKREEKKERKQNKMEISLMGCYAKKSRSRKGC